MGGNWHKLSHQAFWPKMIPTIIQLTFLHVDFKFTEHEAVSEFKKVIIRVVQRNISVSIDMIGHGHILTPDRLDALHQVDVIGAIIGEIAVTI